MKKIINTIILFIINTTLAADVTWIGTTDNNILTPTNWSTGTVPLSENTVIWNGTQQGNIDLVFESAIGGTKGWLLYVQETQTDDISIRNNSTSIKNFRIISGSNQIHTIMNGAGNFLIGSETDSINPIQIILGNAGGPLRINNDSTNELVFGKNVTISAGGATAFDISFFGNGITKILGIFSSNTTNIKGYIRVRNGILYLDCQNYHKGSILIDSGVLEFNNTESIGSGDASSVIRIGQAAITGTLRYSGDTTAYVDRSFSIGNGSLDIHVGEGIIESTGNGNVIFTNPTFNIVASQGLNIIRTLTLDGTSKLNNEIQGVISNNNVDSSGRVAIHKKGIGTWILSGNNTYTGDTTVEEGLLLINGSSISPITVLENGVIGGTGTISSLSMSGGKMDITHGPFSHIELSDYLSVNDIYIGEEITSGTYNVANTITTNNKLLNLGIHNISLIGEDHKYAAYFEYSGDVLQIIIVENNSKFEHVRNGDFESGNWQYWQINDWYNPPENNATIIASINNETPISGENSLAIEISGSDDLTGWQDYHLNFRQTIDVIKNVYYEIEFNIKATTTGDEFYVQFMEKDYPYKGFLFNKIYLSEESQKIKFGGIATDSFVATLSFNIGLISRDTVITIDDISIKTNEFTGDDAYIVIDCEKYNQRNTLSGILLGTGEWYGTTYQDPADQYIIPLNLNYWRMNNNTNKINRALSVGAIPVVYLSHDWWAGDIPGNTNSPWEDEYVTWLAEIDALTTTYGNSIIYDIWNEPDLSYSFTNFEGGTWDRFKELAKITHDRIRLNVPDAIIITPSLSAQHQIPKLKDFFDFCLTNDMIINGISIHYYIDDPSFDIMKENINEIKSFFINNIEYSELELKDIFITEYIKGYLAGSSNISTQMGRPGSVLGMLKSFEDLNITMASRSCWDSYESTRSSCFDGTLSGLLNKDTGLPNAIWWTYYWYGQFENHRIFGSSNNKEIDTIVYSSKANELTILVFSKSYTGVLKDYDTVTIDIRNLYCTGTSLPSHDTVLMDIEKIPYGTIEQSVSALDAPIIIQSRQLVDIINGGIVIDITNLMAYEVYKIKLYNDRVYRTTIMQ